MPATYDYGTLRTRIECSRCHNSVEVQGRPASLTGEDVVLESFNAFRPTGTPVTQWLRWLPNRNRYHAWCRSCERAARQEAAAANPNRETRRRAPAVANGIARRHENRKFGVELEMIFPRGMSRETIRQALTAAGIGGDWRIKGDGSLSGGNGMEVVSPALSGENGMDQLQVVCRVLRRIGAKINRSCGTHVHHDVADLDVEMMKRVAHGWSNNQGLIDGLVSPSRRGRGCYYATPLSTHDMECVDRCTSLSDMRRVGIQRYRTLNMSSYGRHGTDEIRQHQGTGDFEKIRSWILLGQAIIDSAKAAPLPSHTGIRALLDRFGDLMDETAKTFTIGRAVQFGHATI